MITPCSLYYLYQARRICRYPSAVILYDAGLTQLQQHFAAGLTVVSKISMASFTCSSGIQWVINASGRIRPFSIQSMTSGKRPLFSREEKIEISLLVMLC